MNAIDKIMAETLWHIDNEMEEIGWDQNAVLFAVLIGELGEEVGLIELKPAPGWDLCLDQTKDPKQALKVLGTIMSVAPDWLKRDSYPPERLYGLVFVTEAWMLRSPLGATGMPSDYDVASKNHTVHEHPDRIETRFLYSVSMQGDVAALSHERDGIAEAYTSDSKGHLDGQIPALITALIKELSK